jgi:acyl-[acyl-carrier-protein]-phospholipid O-acyltransferase/long-chain-fatty-acid--[acyl-carrier-protein] ligase
MLKLLIRTLLTLLYRVEVRGLEHYRAAGDKVLLVANHTSFLDAVLIAAYIPKKITFAINSHIAQRWWIRPMLSLVEALPLDPTNPMATKTLIDRIKQNTQCMIFPEGRITVTGSLMKIYEGPGMIADKAGAKILPIRIDGAQYTPFSRLRGKVRLRWFPKIQMTILPPCDFNIPAEAKGRKRRQMASAKLYDVMSTMMFETSMHQRTLFESLIDAQAIHGRDHLVVEDIERKPLSYSKFITRCFTLGRVLQRITPDEATVGVLLPNAASTIVTFFALHAYGKTPAMLNFTAGSAPLASACTAAQIKTIVTSRRFVEMAKLTQVIADITASGEVRIVYLEDVRPQVTTQDKLYGVAASYVPQRAYRRHAPHVHAHDRAVVLFTSGSEGTPKGVVLSHRNIQANRNQISARVDFGPTDIVFNCLPMFHSFGLTGGTLLPLLSGLRTFYYPSPLHYRIVPELVYDTNATILFGTDTFLAGYARFAHAYDFHSLRYIFAGAEKLKEETRKVYSEKYGVRIFEGYGATETSPVLAVGTPMHNRAGSVGRLLPDIAYRLEEVTGITEGGKLWVKGPNIMLGYLRAEKAGVLEPLSDGWYDTGDIVTIDDEGYVRIGGRTKRFAKIGGEMVSLQAVETAVSLLYPSAMHACVTLPDEKKGEQIILLTTETTATREAVMKALKEQKLPELANPRAVHVVAAIPLLGTGKIDYVGAKALAEML